MAMDTAQLRELIRNAFPDSEIVIEDLAGDGNHLSLTLTSARFAGKNRVQQHKMVYEAIKGRMGTTLHALAIQTREK